jgi:predicted DCC family thiol-disulfide oxidoreductase YuxK
VQAGFPWIPARAYRDSVQLVGPDGRTWQGAAAVEHILDLLPRGALLTWVFSIPFARPLAERFYRWFARNRYQLGCGEHCQYRPPDVDFGDA